MLTVPALAQVGELEGAPPPLQIPKAPAPTSAAPKPAPRKPTAPRTPAPAPAASSTTSEQQHLAQQAAALRTEEVRLKTLAATLEARKLRLDEREADLAEKEKRLKRLGEDQDADYVRQLAELHAQLMTPEAPASPARVRISYEDARRACTRAGINEAAAHDFYSARYDVAPRYFERQHELRGSMHMHDRDGYLTVDTICQLGTNGAVLRFEVLR